MSSGYNVCPGCGLDLLFQRRLAFIRTKYQGTIPAADVWLTDLKDIGVLIKDIGRGNSRHYVLTCMVKLGGTWRTEKAASSLEEAFRWLVDKLVEAAISAENRNPPDG